MVLRRAAEKSCRNFCLKHGIDPAADLPIAQRTLSPSDFGFHNALKRPDGRLAFLDLEYFGWDDPAKTIADFLLHPGMELSLPLRTHFLHRAIESFPTVPGLLLRVRVVYLLFALKCSRTVPLETLAGL